jgi:enoyl-CoA hydratase
VRGRAFCAGGDVVAAYKAGQDGTPAYDFFRDEYRLNARIGRFPKPYISLLNGIVMGGGAGISVHGSHRIVTENTLFAMPETGIGFFPDVGGEVPSCLISMIISATILHSPATAFAGVIVCKVELPTHAIAVNDLDDLRDDLIATADVDTALARCQYPDYETPVETRQLIEASFAHATLAECTAALEKSATDGSKPANDILTVLATRSPTSVAVTFRQIADGRALDLDDCMRMEYRVASRMLEADDFLRRRAGCPD